MTDPTRPQRSDLMTVQGAAVPFDPLNPSANNSVFAMLTADQQNAMLVEYMHGNLDIGKKAAQMHVDIAAFKNMLGTMSAQTRELAQQENTSVTMSHTQETSVGRTEIIMGNTEQAARGKLTRTMANEFNLMPIYLIGSAIVLLILVSMFLRH